MSIDSVSVAPAVTDATARTHALREASVKLEAQFLAEMLKSTGFGEQSSTFGGGVGETQFASFLREAQAEAIARTGGIGLAESLFRSLSERDHG